MRRPTSVTILASVVFCLSAFNLLGAATGVQRYAFWRGLPFDLPPAYRVISSAVWGLAFGGLATGLWRLKRWGRVGTLAAFSLYLAQGWLDRLVWAHSDYAQVSVPFALMTTMISLALVWGILLRRNVRQRFSS